MSSVMIAGLAIASLLGLGFLANWGILTLFGQESSDRAVHGLVGVWLLLGYVVVRTRAWRWLPTPRKRQDDATPKRMRDRFEHGTRVDRSSANRVVAFVAVALIPCYLGTVFPDLDLLWGIGNHRNPLFHSSLSFLVLVLLLRGRRGFLAAMVAGYGVGLGSHLWWDVVDYGNVLWLPGSALDRLWLGAHGILCLTTPGGIAHLFGKSWASRVVEENPTHCGPPASLSR